MEFNLLSNESIERELLYRYEHATDITEFLDDANEFLEMFLLEAEEYNKTTRSLKLDLLDVELFVSRNDCKCVSNPRAFDSANIPSRDGLLSNEIFGYTMEERAGTFGYIDLHGWFLDPSCYKTWIKLDSAVRNIVHGIKYYKIGDNGEFIEDDNGETGIEFLRKNIKRIKFKNTGSITKDLSLKYMEINRDKMFIRKMIVIPPFYRDKNSGSNDRVVGLGGINKIYNNLIVAANALTATQDYMFDASYQMQGRVQEIILNIYDWFSGNSNKNIDPADSGAGLSGKLGILRRTNTSKTANFSTRLVISAPELKVPKVEDMMVNLDKSAIPLYAVITEFRDFVMYHTRRFFENEFMGMNTYPVIDKNGNPKSIVPAEPMITFSDERIKKEMDRFLHGYNNRFIPVEIPVEGTDEVYYMTFKGSGVDPNTINNNIESKPAIYQRPLTWCDIFYIASVEATTNKQVLITRFPIDSYTNQITTGIEVSSTKETEEIYFNDKLYKYYPKIRKEDIYTDTSNRFVDTLRMSNLYLKAMGGDYDGDQITCKGVYTEEANAELREFMKSKENFISFGCKPTKSPGDDVYQSIYALTKVLSTTNITKSNAIEYK